MQIGEEGEGVEFGILGPTGGEGLAVKFGSVADKFNFFLDLGGYLDAISRASSNPMGGSSIRMESARKGMQ